MKVRLILILLIANAVDLFGISLSKSNDQNSYGSQEKSGFDSKGNVNSGSQEKINYDSKNKGSYGSQEKSGYDSKSKGSYGSQEKSGYDSKSKGSYGSQEKSGYDSKSKGSYGSQEKSGYDSKTKGSYGSQEKSGFDSKTKDSYGSQEKLGYDSKSKVSYGSQEKSGYDSKSKNSYGSQEKSGYDSKSKGSYGSHERSGYDSKTKGSYGSQEKSGYDSKTKDSYGSQEKLGYDSKSKGSYGSQEKSGYDSKSKGSYGSQEKSGYDSKTKDSYGSQEKSGYDSKSKGSYGSQEKSGYDSKTKGSYGSQEKSGYDSKTKGSYGSQEKSGYDSKSKGSYGSQEKSGYDSKNKDSYGSQERSGYDLKSKGSYGSQEKSGYDSKSKSKDSYGSQEKSGFDSKSKSKGSYGSQENSEYDSKFNSLSREKSIYDTKGKSDSRSNDKSSQGSQEKSSYNKLHSESEKSGSKETYDSAEMYNNLPRNSEKFRELDELYSSGKNVLADKNNKHTIPLKMNKENDGFLKDDKLLDWYKKWRTGSSKGSNSYPSDKLDKSSYGSKDYESSYYGKYSKNPYKSRYGDDYRYSPEKDKAIAKGQNNEPKKELYFSSAPGHCKPICPCYMDGVYYDHGDRWHAKDDPCTTYQCGNGFYVATKRGVMFKGQCKDVGITWTEGCFTYRAMLIENLAVYRLIEGGCSDNQGNCWRVGDQFRKSCNTYECRIEGTCYKIAEISKGCSYGDECKPLKHFWHDGCSVYQCVENNGKADYQKLTNEKMYWPEGSYGLLKPKTGCPVDVEEEWSEGLRSHMGNLKNYISYDFDAFGTYNSYVFMHHFCVRQQVNDLSVLPRYQTYWEPGKYCIFRKNYTCPLGFQQGFIGFDDLDSSESLSVSNGTLPDGIYIKDTGFFFCCRNDGDIEEPLVLPKEKPFILFVGSEADNCQVVRGMSHTLEYFAFDDTDGNPRPALNGSIPLTKDGDNNTEIYFCHYRPVDCGCDDGDGNLVLTGQRIKKGCAWYICREENGKRFLDVDVGGCVDDKGNCRNETEVWIESYGETCKTRRCRKIDNGVKVMFQVQTDYKGCKDEEFCRPLNYKTNRGCYSSVCTARQNSPDCYFKLMKAGCSDGNGGCIPLGQQYTKNCLTYMCETETSKCGMKFIKGACKYGDKCYDIGAVWNSNGCGKLKCSMERKKTSVTFRVDVFEQECSYNGKCYKEGATVTEGCYTKKCIMDPVNKYAYFDLVDGGCQYKDQCIGVNKTWSDGCTEFVCRWHRKDFHHTFEKEIRRMSCQFGGECVEEGGTRKHNCIEHQCFITKTAKGQYGSMKPVVYACKDRDGNCLAVNEEIEEKCFLYRCENKTGSAYPQLSIVGGGCEVNGVCKNENSVWTDQDKCVDYQCIKEMKFNQIYMITKPVGVGCSHNGMCRSNGEKWASDKPCFESQCSVHKGEDNKFTRQLKTMPSGCVIGGICREFGFINYDGCIQYKCQKDNETQFAKYGYSKGGCKGYTSSKCYDVGEEWSEPYGKFICLKLKCKQTGNRLGYDINYMCQDANGKCVNAGEKLEALDYFGRKQSDCECRQRGNSNQVGAFCGKAG